MFRSAQQVFWWTIGPDSPGRTGVKEARLTAKTAKSSRAGTLTGCNLASPPGFQTAINARFVLPVPPLIS